MRYIPVIERGEHLDLPFIQYYHKEKVMIKSEYQLPAHLDGEYISSDRFEISVVPNKFLFSVYA
jgi:diacylglycerol kinase (ATP)